MNFPALALILAILPVFPVQQERPFRWLEGWWKAIDREVYEVWELKNGNLFGKGYRVHGQDTTVTENTQINFFDGSFHFTADVAGEQPPVSFRITSNDTNGFVAENPQHDFPKIIRYRRHKNTGSADELEAIIEGNGQRLSYRFVRWK